MTVVMVGVGADGGNVDPPPAVGPDRRFEYVPIPEKATATTESRTFGSIPRRHGPGSLAATIDRIRPGSGGDWIAADDRILEYPVHHDPNLEALTYGAGGKDANVNAIAAELDAGDVLAFYTGLRTDGRMHRYLIGQFTVARDPVVLAPETPEERVREVLRARPENAHAKRYAANGDLYAFDPEKPQGAGRVAIVDGRDPGGPLDRAVRLSGPGDDGHYYLADDVADALDPDGTYLGGFKPPRRCRVSREAFLAFLDRRQ